MDINIPIVIPETGAKKTRGTSWKPLRWLEITNRSYGFATDQVLRLWVFIIVASVERDTRATVGETPSTGTLA